MPQDPVPAGANGTRTDETPHDQDTPAFPAELRTVALSARDFAAGGVCMAQVPLRNPHHTVLHVRLQVPDVSAGWLAVAPGEIALGPGESQNFALFAKTQEARNSVRSGGSPNGYIELAYQRLYPAARGIPPQTPQTGTVQIRLPFATCPNCKKSLERAIASGEIEAHPDFCPFCFERLRECRVCGTLNSWLALRCIQDNRHVLRPGPDWGVLGGNPAHTGSVEEKTSATLVRRWSFPTVPPSRRESALTWSAPVAAYGIIACAGATYDGEAHLYAFDASTGAPLWEPYPLSDPVYPDRGGAAIAGGKLFAATVEGAVVATDAQRGTRLWEAQLDGRVFGTPVPASDSGPLLVAVIRDESEGTLYILEADTGRTLQKTPLPGPSDTSPAFSDGLAFIHDDRGNVTAIDVSTGKVRWSISCGTGFDSAPVVRDSVVFSLASDGTAWCHEAATGAEVWHHTVTNSPFVGTPAHDGTLLYMPANDGLHLFSAAAGKPVRRYPMKMPIRSAPIVAGGTLFFAATDGNIYGALAGRPLEKLYETTGIGAQFVAAPAFSDGTLFAASTNGVLYALAPVPILPPGPPAAQETNRGR